MATDRYENGIRIPHLWSIVLAGGEGKRLAPMVKQWLGEQRPKQYCTFTGTRSMLQHTVDRADGLTFPEQRVTVVGAHHAEEASRQLRGRGGRLVLQPANRDTAAGVYLPLTYVRSADPDATVVIYPADHFVHPEDKFTDAIRHAVRAVHLLKDRLVLLGVGPDRDEFDYGHMVLNRQLGRYGPHSLWTVKRFIEKPEPQTGRALAGGGTLWSTMIIVAKAETLWRMGMSMLPSVLRLFETLQPAIGTVDEASVLDSLYERMPVRNFSFDLLEQVPHQVATLEVHGITWSDWGRPQRIAESLRRIGKDPVFPAELVGAAQRAGTPAIQSRTPRVDHREEVLP
jgi:mannose-1-phosphate guanylyltransferase